MFMPITSGLPTGFTLGGVGPRPGGDFEGRESDAFPALYFALWMWAG